MYLMYLVRPPAHNSSQNRLVASFCFFLPRHHQHYLLSGPLSSPTRTTPNHYIKKKRTPPSHHFRTVTS